MHQKYPSRGAPLRQSVLSCRALDAVSRERDKPLLHPPWSHGSSSLVRHEQSLWSDSHEKRGFQQTETEDPRHNQSWNRAIEQSDNECNSYSTASIPRLSAGCHSLDESIAVVSWPHIAAFPAFQSSEIVHDRSKRGRGLRSFLGAATQGQRNLTWNVLQCPGCEEVEGWEQNP
jgi:hypothetical protein